MNLRNRMSMKLLREKVAEPKPVVQIQPVQTLPDLERFRQDLRTELLDLLNKERDGLASKYDAEINQLKDVIHYNTMKILHETASKIDELEIKCNDLVDQLNGSIDKY